MAVQLATAGIPTVMVARRLERLDALARAHPQLEPLAADLLTTEGRAVVAQRMTDPARPIELLVNNAGFGVNGDFADVSTERHLAMVSLNIGALIELTRVALPVMIERRRGWIMQVSSVAGFQPGPGAATYSATKAFVTSLTEAMREEVRGTGVHVGALCPGFTRTEFQEVSGAEAMTSNIPSMAWMSADDVAAAGLRAMASGRTLEVPGALYKGLTVASTTLPRGVVRRIAGLVIRQAQRAR